MWQWERWVLFCRCPSPHLPQWVGYNSRDVLVQCDRETDWLYSVGALYPTSMRINEQGRLVVNFRTEARFRGLFVISHSGMFTLSTLFIHYIHGLKQVAQGPYVSSVSEYECWSRITSPRPCNLINFDVKDKTDPKSALLLWHAWYCTYSSLVLY